MDLMIYETGNGGDLNLVNGDLSITEGITNQPYLAHFGGNIEASTTGEEKEGVERFDWFGNSFFPNEPDAQINSELERGLANNELSSKGRIELERLASLDLEYLSPIADIESEVSIESDDKVIISDKLIQPSDESENSFIWDATKNELIEEKNI